VLVNDAFAEHLEDKAVAQTRAKSTLDSINGKNSRKLVDEITNKIIELDRKKTEIQNLKNEKKFFKDNSVINIKINQIKEKINGSARKGITGLNEEISELVVGLNNKHGIFLNNKENITLAGKNSR
jgi:hypothetical protein